MPTNEAPDVIELDDRIHIAAAPEVVWSVIVDPDRVHEWMGPIRTAAREGPLVVGARVEVEASFLGVSFDVENEIVEADAPHRYALRGERPFPTALTFVLSAADGGTDLQARVQLDPGRYFPVPKPLLRRQAEKQVRADSRRLKALVEG